MFVHQYNPQLEIEKCEAKLNHSIILGTTNDLA